MTKSYIFPLWFHGIKVAAHLGLIQSHGKDFHGRRMSWKWVFNDYFRFYTTDVSNYVCFLVIQRRQYCRDPSLWETRGTHLTVTRGTCYQWHVSRVISRTIIIRILLRICMMQFSHPDRLKERQMTFQLLLTKEEQTTLAKHRHPDNLHNTSAPQYVRVISMCHPDIIVRIIN